MAGKKGSKTSKTDHVLNLISGMTPNQETSPASPPQEKKNRPSPAAGAPFGSAAPAAETASSGAAEAAAQPAPAPYRAAPILEVARTNHEALSETVHQALEDALEEELREEQEQNGTPEQKPDTDVPPQEQPASPLEAELPPAPDTPTSDPRPEPQPEASQESADSPKRTDSGKTAPPEKDNTPAETKPIKQNETDIVNVMQILVSENLDRYVNMFQLCRCSRCLADVQALALTNLPAKYVVMDHGKLSSMLGYYRHRYATEVMIELTKACNVVKQNPHHNL